MLWYSRKVHEGNSLPLQQKSCRRVPFKISWLVGGFIAPLFHPSSIWKQRLTPCDRPYRTYIDIAKLPGLSHPFPGVSPSILEGQLWSTEAKNAGEQVQGLTSQASSGFEWFWYGSEWFPDVLGTQKRSGSTGMIQLAMPKAFTVKHGADQVVKFALFHSRACGCRPSVPEVEPTPMES